MKTQILNDIFAAEKPIIGMIHLKALPGSPNYDPKVCPMKKIISIAVEEAKTLEEAGVDGLQVENIWDFPYMQDEDLGHETSSSLAVAASKVIESVSIPVGINCHLNGGKSALAASVASGARWIRVFEWVNAYVSHAGITQGIAGKLSRYRSFLKSEGIKFFCDVNVKHGSHFIISDRTVEEQAHDAEGEGAEVLIVTGFETGKAPTPEKVRKFSESVNIPVLIGSGTDKENVTELLKYSDGAIVGSYFKVDGNWKNSVDKIRVKEFMSSVFLLRGGH